MKYFKNLTKEEVVAKLELGCGFTTANNLKSYLHITSQKSIIKNTPKKKEMKVVGSVKDIQSYAQHLIESNENYFFI